ncbi:MAG: hypothetical protein OXJ37_06240 [Bryobacterales bacterium]|nr:hypothetical protein [Bryobacterales bacterium]
MLLQALNRLWPDPQPALVFELGGNVLMAARRAGTAVVARAERELPEADLASAQPQPPDGLQDAIQAVLGELQPVPSPHAAVLLPDEAVRLALFEFDSLPRRAQDLRDAVEERFRNSLPFDPRLARITFRTQHGGERPSVFAAAVATEYVLLCESAFESAGLCPGFVGSSCAAALNLVDDNAMAVLLKHSDQAMTITAVEGGAVRLLRRIALPNLHGADADAGVEEVLADLFPTLVYIEENLGRPVEHLLVAGFGEIQGALVEALPGESGSPARPLLGPQFAGASCGAGLMGYVHG